MMQAKRLFVALPLPFSSAALAAMLTAMLCGALIICPAVSHGGVRAPVQDKKPEPKLTKTEVADNKYGEGGTHTTYSDDKLKVVSENWTDKDGRARESIKYNGSIVERKTWYFYSGGKMFALSAETHKGIDNQPSYGMYDLINALGSTTYTGGRLDAVEEAAKKIGEKFERDGVAPTRESVKQLLDEKMGAAEKGKDEGGPTTVETPALAPTSNTFKPKDGEQPKKEEPKKEEPKKGEPKSDKTSGGGDGTVAGGLQPFAAPGYRVELKTGNGLNSPILTTPYGVIKVNIPGDLRVGELFSGTVWLDPVGGNDEARAKNLSELLKYRVTFGKQSDYIKLSDMKSATSEQSGPANESLRQLFRFGLERPSSSDSLYVTLGDPKDTLAPPVGGIHIPLPPAPADVTPEFLIPTGAQQGGVFSIPGPFDGIVGPDDFVKIGEVRIPIIAESPHGRVVWDTSNFVGGTKVEVGENGRTARCPFHNIAVNLSAGNLHLLRGQTTTLTVSVLGLAGLGQDVPFELVNHSPGIITMSGGNEQGATIHFGNAAHESDLKPDGTYTTTRTLTGITPGGFSITATVHWQETCKGAPEVMENRAPTPDVKTRGGRAN